MSASTTTFTGYIMPNPIWYFSDLTGKPLAGGALWFYNGEDEETMQPVYADPACTIPLPNPLIFSENGSYDAPIFFSDQYQGGYYLEIYDAAGLPIATIEDFVISDAQDAGGDVVEYITSDNLLINNVFYENLGTQNFNTTSAIESVLAPSTHVGFAQPDIRYLRSSTTTAPTEIMTFENFAPGDVFPAPNATDPTPEFYLNYVCSSAGTGETYKAINFPVQARLKTLEEQVVTASVYIKSEEVGQEITVQVVMYAGSGSVYRAGPAPVSAVYTTTTANTWERFTVTLPQLPTSEGVTLGECGDDCYQFQIQLPFNQMTNISIAKPCLYIGTSHPQTDFDTYDHIRSITDSPHSGDFLFLTRGVRAGWIPCYGSIGSATSGATYTGPINPWFLYKACWEEYQDAYAPVAGGRGASAATDFAANKALSLPNTFGRNFASAGTASNGSIDHFPGSTLGNESLYISPANIPSGMNLTFNILKAQFASGNESIPFFAPGNEQVAGPITVNNAETVTPLSPLQPTFYTNLLIKL